jgi:hypothetical protein
MDWDLQKDVNAILTRFYFIHHVISTQPTDVVYSKSAKGNHCMHLSAVCTPYSDKKKQHLYIGKMSPVCAPYSHKNLIYWLTGWLFALLVDQEVMHSYVGYMDDLHLLLILGVLKRLVNLVALHNIQPIPKDIHRCWRSCIRRQKQM